MGFPGENGFGDIKSADRLQHETRRMGKLHGVPALAGPDRLKAGLHTKGPWLPAKQKRDLCLR